MSQASVAFASSRGGLPGALNCLLALIYVFANVFQFAILPLWLLPSALGWAWVLLPLALLTSPFWSLIHEAIHDLFHSNKTVNGFFGRLLAILFGSPFGVLRLSHLLHHRLNRMPVEGTEYYDGVMGTKRAAAPRYFFQIFLGLYLVEVASSLYFLLPGKFLGKLRERFLPAQSASGRSMQSWLAAESLHQIRFDGLLTVSWLSLSFYLYGQYWFMLLGLLLARGFLISFLDNVYHYETPVGNVFYAKNLRLPSILAKLLLNFNLHGIHHLNPAISWIHLPTAFEVQGGKFQGGYFAAALRQLHGPIALQDLPQGEPVSHMRPF